MFKLKPSNKYKKRTFLRSKIIRRKNPSKQHYKVITMALHIDVEYTPYCIVS